MKKEKMLIIANELNRCLAHSDIYAFIEFRRNDNGVISIYFTHCDERYLYNNKTLFIYDWQSDERIESLVNQAKEVIAGEALLDE
ncbi:hypothetical protein O0A02_00350 [Staphylococcus pseudintermedius]|nr:hypothetical protein [Staphylococcus pseudintermedius]MDK3686821.1 hypothetical protein [Staphylococcus pseudintermedius]MDK3846634.1 hypothetical protein [Staphylococcus pseudintermedius]